MVKIASTLLLLFVFIFLKAQDYETVVDHFDNVSGDWLQEDYLNKKSEIKDSKFILESIHPKQTQSFLTHKLINPKDDYRVEVKMTKISGSEKKAYGITWGFFGWGDYYSFSISSEGLFRIDGKKDKKYVAIKDWTKAPDGCIHETGQANTLVVEKSEHFINYYVNNTEVFSSKNLHFKGTNIGFFASGTMQIEVDYVKTTLKKNTINLAERPVNGYELENLGHMINSAYTELAPLIVADGNSLYIARNHPSNYGGENKNDIWYTKKNEKGEWEKLQHADTPLNNKGSNFVISASPDGNSLLIGNTYNPDGSRKGDGISIAYKKNGKWMVPKEQKIIGFQNQSRYVNYFLAADNTKLIMSLKNYESFGERDLFISFLQEDGQWGKPQNMGNVLNTFTDELSPFLAADGKTLYFASYGHPGYGSSDIFMSKRLDDTWANWSKPQNLGSGINSRKWDAYYNVPAKGDYAYVVSQNENLSYGKEDIFRVTIAEAVKPEPVIIVKGKVFNQKTKEAIRANIFYEKLSTGIMEGKAISTPMDGYKIVLPKGASFGFRAEAKGFIPVSENIDLTELETYAEKEVNLYLVPIEKGQVVRLNNIFFDYNKASLRTESYPELNRLVKILSNGNGLKIKIEGHTDSDGTQVDNLELSKERAKIVLKYLIDRGISQNQIIYKGYGESKPVASNTTDKGRQLNRRVEFVIL